MNTGHDGKLTTIHASSTEGALRRIATPAVPRPANVTFDKVFTRRMLMIVSVTSLIRLTLLIVSCTAFSFAQESIREEIRAIALEAHGKVSVACSLPESSLNCDLNPNSHPPMQSVFKLPLALAALHQVEQGTLTLDQPVRFRPEDRILPHVYSP